MKGSKDGKKAEREGRSDRWAGTEWKKEKKKSTFFPGPVVC